MTSPLIRSRIITAQTVADRCIPFFKFSQNGQLDEPYSPCPWRYYGERSVGHQTDYEQFMREADITALLKAGKKPDDYNLVMAPGDRGPGFDALRTGQALYCHASRINGDGTGTWLSPSSALFPSDYVNLEYWLLFPFNVNDYPSDPFLAFGPEMAGLTSWLRDHEFDHKGDVVGVHVVYEMSSHSIVRVSYSLHGSALQLFAFDPRTKIEDAEISGRDRAGAVVKTSAKKQSVSDGAFHHEGSKLTKASEGHVFFVADAATNEFTHPAVYLEWGTHEPWPNQSGWFVAAPTHNGDGFSILPSSCRILPPDDPAAAAQSVPDETNDAVFAFYGGCFGDPKGLTRHKAWLLDPKRAEVPDGLRKDGDLYRDYGALKWPPNKP